VTANLALAAGTRAAWNETFLPQFTSIWNELKAFGDARILNYGNTNTFFYFQEQVTPSSAPFGTGQAMYVDFQLPEK
jgi:hypothetical protein